MKVIELARKCMSDKSVDYKDRTKILELNISEYLAKCLPIPTDALVASPADHFRTTLKVGVLQDLSKVNEFHVIDLDQTCDLVYHMWLSRYLFVHDANNPKIARLATAVLIEESNHIPNQYRTVADQYPKAFFSKYEMEEG